MYTHTLNQHLLLAGLVLIKICVID